MGTNSAKINTNANTLEQVKIFISDDFGNDISSIVQELECHVLLSHKYAE